MSAFDELEAEEQKSAFDELDAAEQATPPPVQPAPAAPAQPRTNAAEAAGLGALNSATLGFNDEIGGGVNALMQWAGLVPEIPRSAYRGDMTGANTSGYDAERNRQRALEASAKDEHGLAYGAGQVATGLAMGGGASGGAKAVVGRLAAEGAAQGVGESEAETVTGIAQDAGRGAATTLGTAGALKVGGKLLRKVGDTAPATAARARLQRVVAAGIDPNSAKQMGSHTVDQQAEAQKRLGIGKAKWGFLPASTDEINQQATAAVGKLDASRNDIANQLANTPVWAGEVGTKLRHQVKAEQGPIGRRADTNAWPSTPKAEPPPVVDTPHGAATAPGGKKAPNVTNPGRGPKMAYRDWDRWKQAKREMGDEMADRLFGPNAAKHTQDGRRLKPRPAHDPATAPTVLPSLPPVQATPVLPPQNVKVRNPEYEPIRQAKLERAGYFDAIGEQPFPIMNQLRKEYGGRAKFGTDTPQAAVRQDVHGAINDVMERAAGPELGPQWRALGRDEAMAIRARDYSEDMINRREKSYMPTKGEMAGGAVGASIGGPWGAVLGYGAGRMMRGRGKSAVAAATEVSASVRGGAGAMGRALDANAPVMGGALGRSILKVQQAAEQDPQEAAKAHFLESSTNPEYRDYTHKTE